MDGLMALGSMCKDWQAALFFVATTLLGCGRTQENPDEAPSFGGMAQANTGGIGAMGGGHSPSGAAPAAGAASGGSGGDVAGSGTGGGGQPPRGAPWPSEGCNKPRTQGVGIWQPFSAKVTGATLDPTFNVPPHERAYSVRLPYTYDPSVPYRAVYVAGGCGATGTSDDLEVTTRTDKPIYVSLATPPMLITGGNCFDNSGIRSTEWEYFSLVAAEVEKNFCVDKNAEVVEGKHSGGTLANMLGCYFSGVDPNRKFGPDLTLRAQISFAAGQPVDLPACGGPIAGLWMHDTLETTPVSDSTASFERVMAENGCTDTTSSAWGSDSLATIGCKKYLACPAEYPLVFCETTGHGRQGNYVYTSVAAVDQLMDELASP